MYLYVYMYIYRLLFGSTLCSMFSMISPFCFFSLARCLWFLDVRSKVCGSNSFEACTQFDSIRFDIDIDIECIK